MVGEAVVSFRIEWKKWPWHPVGFRVFTDILQDTISMMMHLYNSTSVYPKSFPIFPITLYSYC